MNLNKYTKAELISKLHKESKKIDSKRNQNTILNKINLYFYQIWDLILVFKNILVKLTLISFFIQIFRKYKIFRKLWTMLNTLVMTIFGISLLDNFGFEFIQHFLIEIRVITANIIDYFSKTHFYVYLSELFKGPTTDIEKTVDDPSREQKNISWKNTTDESGIKESKKGTKESHRDSKISEWLKPAKDNIPNEQIEDSSFYDQWRFYILTGTIIVAGCFIWVYSDEIQSSWTTFYEWVLSFRSGTGDSPGSNNPDTREHPRFDIQKRLKDIVKEELPTPEIELTDKQETYSKIIEDIKKGKGKEILTSASLEDLNNKATESWAEGSTSPISEGSDVTIKPSSSKEKLVSIDELSPGESSVSKNLIERSSNIDNSSSLEIGSNVETVISSLKPSWKDLVPTSYSDKIKKIEFMFEKERPIDTKTLMELGLDFVEMLRVYDNQVTNFNIMKDAGKYSAVEIHRFSSACYHYREWLDKYNHSIFRKNPYNINIGRIFDDPKTILGSLEII